MMNIIWGIFMCASMITAVILNRGDIVLSASVDGAMDALQVCIKLAGGFALWTGLLKVLENAGGMAAISKAIRPVLNKLFPDLQDNPAAISAIILNLSANILGLGNAATPSGIKAMQEMERSNKHPGVASDAMCMFIVLNTACLQFFPSTIISMRAAAGSVSAAGIIPAVFVSSAFACIAGIILCRAFTRVNRHG